MRLALGRHWSYSQNIGTGPALILFSKLFLHKNILSIIYFYYYIFVLTQTLFYDFNDNFFFVNLYCVSALTLSQVLGMYIYSMQNSLHILMPEALSCYHQSFLSQCLSADILLSVWFFYFITFTIQDIILYLV